MEILEKKEVFAEKKPTLPQENPKRTKNHFWLFGLIFCVILGIFFAIFSENTTENRYKFLKDKIVQNKELSESEKIEFCNLFFKVKGFSLENCEKLGIKELKTYITYKATVGKSLRKDYKATFFEQYPYLKGKIFVHHAVEQALVKRTKLFTESELHSIENLRGIPIEKNNQLHLRILRIEWDNFYRTNLKASREEILDFASYIDLKYGHLFLPPVPLKNE